MTFDLPDLPYEYDALEPHVSAKTLRVHHGKHHQGYVDGVNEALGTTGKKRLTLEQVILEAAGRSSEQSLFDKAAQSWNHAFFWNCMTPDGGGEPEGELARHIDMDFDGYDKFRAAFKSAATGLFGSGWTWLVIDNGQLRVKTTANAMLPMVQGQHALLTCDVWEHAYYLDYQNERGKFVDAFLDHLVNWDFVASQFEQQLENLDRARRRRQDARADFAHLAFANEGAR